MGHVTSLTWKGAWHRELGRSGMSNNATTFAEIVYGKMVKLPASSEIFPIKYDPLVGLFKR